MTRLLKACVCLAVVDVACGLRRSSQKDRAHAASQVESDRVPNIACPVMAALVNNGMLKLDSKGLASQQETTKGLMAFGSSAPMSQFQSLGIVAFVKGDTHQEKRVRDGSKGMTDLYLNYNLWNPKDECTGSKYLRDGRPCNANIGFQQHGFSTLIRDPSNARRSASKRWSDWMDRKGVLVYDIRLRRFDKVMKIEGLGQLLKYIRLDGDKHGEFALNADNSFRGSPLSFYHPSAKNSSQYKPCSQWQAVGAWSAFWAAFARVSSDGRTWFMPEDDLKRFFLDANFPKGWSAKPFGFKETFKTVRELKGMGAGEEWVEEISSVLRAIGEDGSEEQYTGGLLGALKKIGARDDDVQKNVPR